MELTEPFPQPHVPAAVTWTQDTLVPLPAADATLRIGVVGKDSRAQLLLEVREPRSGELVAMWSIHSMDVHWLRPCLEQTITEMLEWLSRNL